MVLWLVGERVGACVSCILVFFKEMRAAVRQSAYISTSGAWLDRWGYDVIGF